MKNIRLISLLTALLLMAGCAKDQETLNKLEGTWKYKSAKIFGFTIDLVSIGIENGTLQFYKCKTKDANCTGIINLTGSDPQMFQYNINKDGNQISVVNNNGSTTLYNIKTLTSKDLVYTTLIDTASSGSSGVTIEVEFGLSR